MRWAVSAIRLNLSYDKVRFLTVCKNKVSSFVTFPVVKAVALALITFSFGLQAQSEDDSQNIEKISVVGQHEDKALLTSGFNVEILLADEFKSGNYNLVEILEQSPGINVRQNGGLGSEFNLTLNGLSGNQIRYFFDGIPMEDFGSALSFPANLVEQIEVFKGVVPVSLGADALGGAINITTPSLDQDLADLSYTFGSFNTHKATVFKQKHFVNDWFVRLAANAEHSDNDYWMSSVNDVDHFGNVLGKIRAKRFHDQYSAGMVNLKSGVVNTNYADELSVALTYAKDRNNEQHPEKTVNDVYGKYHSTNNTQLLSAIYKKQFKHIIFDAYVLSGDVENVYTDEFSRDYDWHGNFQIKKDETQGELGAKSLFTLNDDVLRGKLGIKYPFSGKSSVSLSHSHDYLKRKGHDTLNVNNRAFSKANWIRKGITGLSLDSQDLVEGLDVSIFAKYYDFTGEINGEETVDFNLVSKKTDVSVEEFGYGAAASVQVHDNLLLKSSFEKAYRLPQAHEILGTGQYVLPNSGLLPETSDNVNLGAKFEIDGENTLQYVETNLFYRDSSDFIYYVANQVVYGQYTNLQDVETKGIEATYYLSYLNTYSLQLNATYQDLINRSRFDYDGVVDLNNGNRMPNEPYLFANARLSADFEIGQDLLKLTWTSSFVEKFYLHWENTGDKKQKLDIPSQFTHDLDVTYSFADGDYHLTLSGRNVFDAKVYDNFNIQKPGRALYLKFRYLF